MRWLTVNTKLVQEFSKENNLKVLAFYYQVKTLFANSTVFNATGPNLQRIFSISGNTLKKYIRILECKKMVVYHNGNLTCLSVKKIPGKVKLKNAVRMYFLKKDTLKRTQARLQASVLKKSAEHQQFFIDKYPDKFKASFNKRLYQKYFRAKCERGTPVNEELRMSNASLGIKLNKSPQSISRIKKDWDEMGLVKFSRQFKPIGKVYPSQKRAVKDSLPSGAFVAGNGVLWQSLVSSFVLTDDKLRRNRRKKQTGSLRTIH